MTCYVALFNSNVFAASAALVEVCALLSVNLVIIIMWCRCLPWGTGIRGLMRGMATLPNGNQELLVVKDKVGRPQVRKTPGELGVSKLMECDIFPSVL